MLDTSPRDDTAHNTDEAPDLARKRKLFRSYEDNKQREIEEQKEARRYYSGRQWTDAEMAVHRRRNMPTIWDNRIARKVDFLVGVEQRMRRDPKAYARGPQDVKSADTATACIRFACDQNRWEQMASNCAHDGMVSGVGVVWVGAESGRRGADVKMKQGQIDRFFYDPRSTLPDFSDARYMGMHLWLDIEDVKAEYPGLDEELDALVDRDEASLSTLDEERDEQWSDFEQKRIRVVEMYERKPMPTMGGFAWYFCKFSGSLTLESAWSSYVDENGVPDCPYVAWSPYVDERGDRYGVVRNMRPMQDEVNHRRSKLLHMANVRTIHMRDGVIEDVDEARKELAKADGVIRHQGTWGQDIGVVENDGDMKAQAELMGQAQASLENLGPNPGLIGKGGGVADQSGRAILAQRDSGMTELSPVFERLRDWKLRVYRKIWSRIKQTWTAEKYIRITEDPKAPQYLGLNQYGVDPMTGMATAQNLIAEIDVDIILDEGPDTIVMQEELMQTLSQLGEAAMGPLGRVMIELSQVSNKDQLLSIMDKASAPNPEVAALNERMAALEAQLKQATIAKTHAETEAKRVDSAVKLAAAMIPPQAVPPMFPMPFGDQGGQMQPPQPPPQQILPPQPPEMAAPSPGVPSPAPGGPPMPPDMMPGAMPFDAGAEFSSGLSAGPTVAG